MPTTFDYSTTVTCIPSLTCVATFKIIVKGNIDLQGNNIMGYTSRQLIFSSGINYSGNSLTMTCSSSGSKVTVTVDGYVLFEYTDPIIGLEFSVNEPFEKTITFDALEYI